VRAPVIITACLLLAAGCTQRKWQHELFDGGMRHSWTRLNSSGNGTGRLKIEVRPGETAMLTTASVEPGFQVHVRKLIDPIGQLVFNAFEWNSSAYSKSNAAFVADTVTLNWPITASDSPLLAGRYELEFGVVDTTNAYTSQPMFVDAYFKTDDTFTDGILQVAIVYAGGLEDDGALRTAVDGASVVWTELYNPMGLHLAFEEYKYPRGNLEPPAFGTEDAFIDIANVTPTRAVNVVVVERIDAFEEIFGISGDIPGPLVASTRSGVLVSAELAAGPDGEFSDEEVRLLGETLAHEASHYIGLFHPVETTWDAWDVLSDTPECDSEGECEEDLARNLMFPYPVCGSAACTPQDTITPEQAGVLHRYVGVW
jgi:hypothetical protein